ncbi:MAG: hypothetical protein ABIC95_03425 [archaeon]
MNYYLNNTILGQFESAKDRNTYFEVGTNIILNIGAKKEEARDYYSTMDELTSKYDNLRFRYNTFFMIPSNCAPHIQRLSSEYVLYSQLHPELKVISIPQIMLSGETTKDLEKKLLWNHEALSQSKSNRKLQSGTYQK